MRAEPRWIILSPHLDDGVLSCGGMAAALARHVRVEIWTIFCRAPLRGPYSPLAQWLHGASGGLSGSRLARQRRHEDREACRTLGIRHRHFRWRDAVYRKDRSGTFFYQSTRQDRWHSADEKLVADIANELRRQLSPSDMLLAPLALGGHVDHLIVHHAAGRAGHESLAYYADIPYLASYPREAEWVVGGMWRSEYALPPAATAAWVKASLRYASQRKMLEHSSGPLPELIEQTASQAGVFLQTADAVVTTRLGTPGIFAPPALVPRDDDAQYRRHTQQRTRNSLDRPMMAAPPAGSGQKTLAPIALFAFNRLDLLKKTVAALERSRGFSASPVHVFSDAARPGNTAEAAAVSTLRAWLRGWCERHGATLHEAPENRGLRASIVSSVSEILKTHERIIVLEDDLVVSRSFLTFMNQALDSYPDREEIMQVSGHFVPHRGTLPPIGLLRVPASWGWATWRRAWQHYSDDAGSLLSQVRKLDTREFDINGSYGFLEALEKNAAGTLDTWAVRWYASVFLRGGLTVYPGASLVRNIGFDARGTNCGPSSTARALSRQTISHRSLSPDWHNVGTAETESFAAALEAFYRWQQAQWGKPTFNERLRARLALLTGRPASV